MKRRHAGRTALLLGVGVTLGLARALAEPADPANARDEAAPIDAETAAGLEALGYVTWTDESKSDPSLAGVTRHDPERAFPGINYYCSEPAGVAHFIDMQGEVIWSVEDRSEIAPAFAHNRCKLIEPYDASSILMVTERTHVSRFALDSTAMWSREGDYHHDVAVADDGTIYAIRDAVKPARFVSRDRPIRDTELVALSPEGEEIRSWPLMKMLLHEPDLMVLVQAATRRSRETPIDVFHTNSITVVERDDPFPGIRNPEHEHVLVVLNRIHTVALVNLETERIAWSWGDGEIEFPHDASLLPDGNVLVFDNGNDRGHSRVIELDPANKQIVWEYTADPKSAFFSYTRGGAQRLPNGNVLITDSEAGRAFEVTRSGEVVWEFWNPHIDERQGEDGVTRRRATVFRVNRLEPEALGRIRFPEDVKQSLRARGYLEGDVR